VPQKGSGEYLKMGGGASWKDQEHRKNYFEERGGGRKEKHVEKKT